MGVTGQLTLDVVGGGPAGPESWAVISDCGRYRYELGRRWGGSEHGVTLLDWVMLNPSTADADQDDPTIRRCMKFAKDWGFHGIRVTNLFGYRATNPDELAAADDPFGPDNGDYLSARYPLSPMTVCAWGAHKLVSSYGNPSLFKRESAFVCLGYNKDGSPKHPLYVPANRGVSPWPKPDPKERNY